MGNAGGHSEFHQHVHETAVDSRTGEHPERVFTSLHHLIDGEWMREAYRRTRKDGATGIDGVTAADYEKDPEANLDDLLGRMKSGRYFAPPVRRHYIPKADGTKLPLGIPTFEDKVAQRAILMLLEPIYETDFLPSTVSRGTANVYRGSATKSLASGESGSHAAAATGA